MSDQLAAANPGPVMFAGPPNVPVAGPTSTSPNIVFGITFDLNGQQIPISSSDILDIKTKGIDLALPGPTTIGTIDDFITWFNTQFGIQLPDPTTFPPPLNTIFGKITSLVWTVNAAHVHVYPAGSTESTAYTLTVTAAWAAGQGIPLIPNVLTIDGAVFGVTNESTPAS